VFETLSYPCGDAAFGARSRKIETKKPTTCVVGTKGSLSLSLSTGS